MTLYIFLSLKMIFKIVTYVIPNKSPQNIVVTVSSCSSLHVYVYMKRDVTGKNK